MCVPFRQFLTAEEGAVTVDWVVLTAAIIGLALAVLVPIGISAASVSDGVSSAVSATSISTPDTFRQ